MKNIKINFSKLVTNFLINFASVFAILIIITCAISEYIYSDMILLKDIIIIGIFSFISSVILLLIFSLNKIGVVTQYLLVYCFLSIVILLLGYFLYIYEKAVENLFFCSFFFYYNAIFRTIHELSLLLYE